MPLTSHGPPTRGEPCGVCGSVGCRTHPETEFWFPDNLPPAGTMAKRKAEAEQEREQPVTGDASRPTADAYAGRQRKRRARTGRRSRWPEEDRQAPRGENR